MEKEVLEKFIAKLLSGEITSEEKTHLEKWYTSFDADPSYTDKLSDLEKNKLENKLLQNIDQNIKNVSENSTKGKKVLEQPKSFRRRVSPYFYKAAAVFIAVFTFVALAYQSIKDNTITYSTTYGQISYITLPDSSTVILNGNSTLTYSDQWLRQDPREVFLDGEALFSVKHAGNDQKFIVHTSDEFNVEVLGTEFNIKKRKSGTRVVLNSGKVSLNINAPEFTGQITMNPGELVEFVDNPANYSKKEVNVEKYSSWKDKKLLLEHTSLKEIILILQETYGLNITIVDKDLLNQKVSGSIPIEDVNTLLKDVAITFGLTIEIGKETIEFKRPRK